MKVAFVLALAGAISLLLALFERAVKQFLSRSAQELLEGGVTLLQVQSPLLAIVLLILFFG